MYIANTLSLLLASAAFAAARGEQEQAQALRAPILASREFTPIEEAGLERRGTCPDGGQCFLGQCCGTGCSPNCCAHDNGGIGCNLAERCQFDGNVFVGCCNGFMGRCTGEATRVTVHTPADSTMFNTGAPATSDATTTTGGAGPTTAESPGLPTSESDSSSSSSADSTSRSATSPTTSAQATRSTAGSSSRSASSSSSANDSAGTTASSTSAAQGGETGTVNAAPAITGYMGLELGAVAVGALLAL
ncbi:hypothetical protein ANOM_008011 [Aspergillus nomiae NRRL 13137]|uniref:GPI anchored protein n=1 Tax=Aspergillus nomiae NRRL (strain ATCC 15546 / NRRL 13137 / CBS 260.88 / M93) TaxID=1509407 RepID=A0A0L1IW75_ASPN3|nr:uncharacterized protein ANOM_008011 [Aspergillus nomiae NRRL 13137]KNG83816.1 hypothetical protein ANOM_008011 [Aspergillus nomiae NRRL 13137]